MKKFYSLTSLFIVISLIISPVLKSRAQGNCLEIKSILVDACGSPEGENEMVRFDVGSASLNVGDINVTWPNNNWLGLCQNANTATLVSTINQNIVGCGSVTEPVGGVLPANSKVLFCTSTNINISFNSFVNLNEDLVIIFQCSGNTNGHFANYNSSPGLRTLVIGFTGSGGCYDTVTYDRTQLVNHFGTIGGSSVDNDGAFVEFTAAGTPTYLNNGCQVLSTGISLFGGPDVGICPGSTTAALSATGSNLVGNPQWSGGTGTFTPPDDFNTVYTPGVGETGIVNLVVTGYGPCNSVITDTVRVNIVPSLPSVFVSVGIDGVFTSNFSDPGYYYNWYEQGSSNYIPGAYSPTYTPTVNGCYYMVLTTQIGGCTTQSNTDCITNVGLADPAAGYGVSLLNNPGSSPSIVIHTGNSSEVFSVETVDVYGRTLKHLNIPVRGSDIHVQPDWSGLTSGVYLVRIGNGNFQVEKKAILLR